MRFFPIDIIRQIVEQTLAEQHYLNPSKYFGGKDQVSLMSFYEQLQKEAEVNRFVNIYNDLVDQQNRTGLIMNGTILAPENPTITNLYNSLIIPLTFTLYFRVKLEDRDTALETMYNVIDLLKGKIILINVLKRLAPSILAASSKALGTVSKNPLAI